MLEMTLKWHDIVWSGSASRTRHQREENKIIDCIRETFPMIAFVVLKFYFQFPLDNVQQIYPSWFCADELCALLGAAKMISIFWSAVRDRYLYCWVDFAKDSL